MLHSVPNWNQGFQFLSELFSSRYWKKTPKTYSVEFQTATCKEYIEIEFTYPSFEVYSNCALSYCIYFLNNEIWSNISKLSVGCTLRVFLFVNLWICDINCVLRNQTNIRLILINWTNGILRQFFLIYRKCACFQSNINFQSVFCQSH